MTGDGRRGRLLAAAAILLTAVNLRLAVTSVGPVLTEIRTGLGMNATVAGLLTSVPVVCFASFGLAAPRIARRVGAARVIAAGLVVLAASRSARSRPAPRCSCCSPWSRWAASRWSTCCSR